MSETREKAPPNGVGTGPAKNLQTGVLEEPQELSSYLIGGSDRLLRDLFPPSVITYTRQRSEIDGLSVYRFTAVPLLADEILRKLALMTDGICAAFKGQVVYCEIHVHDGYKINGQWIKRPRLNLASALIDFGDDVYQTITIEDSIEPEVAV